MDSRYIAWAVPGFLVLIAIELLVSRAQRAKRYRFHDSFANLACGIGQQVIEVCSKALPVAAYGWVFRHYRVHNFALSSAVGWVLAIVVVDFLYYWFHRISHRMNALWALHAVHHQSEEYNLSVALRQSWFDPLVEWTFYLPLAVVGLPIEMYLTSVTVSRLYQYWIHTRAIGRLGPWEWAFNTPSHHRVHHGIDPLYIDRNYGGILILWDRMFGTFQREEHEPTYGTVKALSSWNSLHANVAEWQRAAALSRGAARTGDKIWAWFAPPEWRPQNLGGNVTVPEVDHAAYRKYDRVITRSMNAYQFLNIGAAVAGVTVLLYFADVLPAAVLWTGGFTIVFAVRNGGALLDGSTTAATLEWVRIGLLAGAVAFLSHASHASWSTAGALGGAVGVCVAVAFAWARRVPGETLRAVSAEPDHQGQRQAPSV